MRRTPSTGWNSTGSADRLTERSPSSRTTPWPGAPAPPPPPARPRRPSPPAARADARPRTVLTTDPAATPSLGRRAATLVPGLAAAVAVALAAPLGPAFLPASVAEVTVAILFGIVVASVAGPRLRPLAPGLGFASQRVL